MNKLFYAALGFGGGDPITKAGLVSNPTPLSKNPPGGDQLDVADILANFVGRGDKNLQNDQALKDFHYLSTKVGQPMASKLVNHVIMFNQRPDMQKQPFAAKLNSLYTIGSNDKDVDGILKKTNNLGAGPNAIANNSWNIDSQSATGRNPLTNALATSKGLNPNKQMLGGLGL
jgi:hypothetical protein